MYFSRRTFGRDRKSQEHQRRIGRHSQRISRILRGHHQLQQRQTASILIYISLSIYQSIFYFLYYYYYYYSSFYFIYLFVLNFSKEGSKKYTIFFFTREFTSFVFFLCFSKKKKHSLVKNIYDI